MIEWINQNDWIFAVAAFLILAIYLLVWLIRIGALKIEIEFHEENENE